jgi:hypothetical protein
MMLNAHSDLAIPNEAQFLTSLVKVRRRYTREGRLDVDRLIRDATSNLRFREWGLPEDAAWRRVRALGDPTFASALGALYAAYAEQEGKPRWGDKTPSHVLFIPALARLFPDARFVHVIRDGRDVSLSLVEAAFWRRRRPRGIRSQRSRRATEGITTGSSSPRRRASGTGG